MRVRGNIREIGTKGNTTISFTFAGARRRGRGRREIDERNNRGRDAADEAEWKPWKSFPSLRSPQPPAPLHFHSCYVQVRAVFSGAILHKAVLFEKKKNGKINNNRNFCPFTRIKNGIRNEIETKLELFFKSRVYRSGDFFFLY